MITPSFSLTATERVLPKLTLDFTTGVLDPRITFTRTTGASNPATYVNSSGVITAATNNQPRFDYDPITLQPKGLLIEESRTNLLTYSEQFDNPVWTKNANVTVTSNSTIAPDGTLSCDQFTMASTSAFPTCWESASVSANTAYTFSFYVKRGSMTNMTYRIYNVSGSSDIVSATSYYSSTNSSSFSRISVSFTTPVGCTSIRVYTLSDTTSQTAGTNVFIWGAQLEPGAFSTSYIPTTSAALTRNVDAATMTGTNFSSWWNPTQYSFVISIDTNGKSGDPRIISGGGAAQDVVGINISSGVAYAESYDGGLVKSATGFSTSGSGKVAVAWASNVGYASTSGGAVASAAQTTGFGALTGIYLGSQDGGAQCLNGHIKTIYYYPQKLTNAELQAFSK